MSRAEDFVQRGLNKVPGYKGYRNKEDRRDEDKRIRVQIADAIVAEVDRLTAYNASLSAAREFAALESLEREVGQLRTLADRIRHASYGYGGIFTENSVDASALEQLRLFDAALLNESDSLSDAVSAMTSATPPASDAQSAVTAERNRITVLFNGRSQVVDEGRATDDSETVSLLAIPEKVVPSPLLQVNKGDALSVLGDNYIANGTVKLSTSAGEIVLARVSTETTGATWLLGSSIPAMQSARLTEDGSDETSMSGMSSATAAIETAQGKESDVAARYAYQDLGEDQVAFSLALGDSVVSYRGSVVNDQDIEVYSAN